MGKLEKAWVIACLPFLWAWHKHPNATGWALWVLALLAAGWGDSGRGM